MYRRMLGAILKSRKLWAVVVLSLGFAVAAVAFKRRLDHGPIPLAFLDQHIAEAIGGLWPGITAEVEATALARSGRGVALRVSAVRLLHDGSPILSLPALSVRPSFGALLAGRIVLARVDVDDAELVLTRQPDGIWMLGSGAGGVGVPVLDMFGTRRDEERREQGLPRIALTRTHLMIDDQSAGVTLDLANGDLLVSPRPGFLDVTVSATLRLATTGAPVPGRLALPMSAAASIALSDDGELGAVTFSLTGGMGELTPPGDTGAPFALAGLDGAGAYTPESKTLRFERLAAVIGASRVALQATLPLNDPSTLTLDGTVDTLPVTALTRFWPVELATAARIWVVENVREGALRRCRVQLGGLGAPPPAPAAASPARGGQGNPPVAPSSPAARAPGGYDIACGFDGVLADYLRPLDPIRAAKGSARLTADRLAVDVDAGQVGACRVEGGTLRMNLAVNPPRAEIHANLSGAGADVLALVDRPPLRLVTPLGITPKDLGGQSRVYAELKLPVRPRLTAADVVVKATAELTGASLPPLLAGIGIKDGDLDVRIEGSTFEVKGKTAITGIPAVTTPVMMKVSIAPGAATPGRQGNSPTQQVKLALDGDGLIARGTAGFVGTTLTTLDVERLRLGGSDVAGTLQRRPNGAYEATLTGASLDLETVLADPRLAAGDGAGFAASYALALRLGSVRLASDLNMRNLHGSVQGVGGLLGAVALTGSLVPSGDFQVTLDGSAGTRRIVVTSDQAGALLHALGGVEQIVGGSLKLDGVTDRRGPQGFLDGKLVLRDFKIVRAPVLTKVLSIGSLSGIASLVQGEGLPVSKARLPFQWEGGRLRIREFRAVGAVGLTAEGVIDQRAGTCDVRGNIIPAYTLNTVLGKIPLLGRLLVGGKGQGVFGIDYRVNGKTANPSVFVNPLTSIAPTILRSWFVDPFLRDFDAEPAAALPKTGR